MPVINPHDPASWPIGWARPKPEPITDMTDAQASALRAVYDRLPLNAHARALGAGEVPMSWPTFRDSAERSFTDDTIMVYWCGMWLGIEPNGHTHS